MKGILVFAIGAITILLAGTAAQASTVSFKYGINGYTDTTDIEIWRDEPNSTINDALASVDGSDSGDPRWSLLRFDSIFGDEEGQIAAGSTISSATLTFYTHNTTGDTVSFYRMMQDWSSNATWNSMGNGIQNDDVEAASQSDASIHPTDNHTHITVDVTTSLALWAADPDSNFGWFIRSNGTNGWDFYTSGRTDSETRRPMLTVEFEAPAPAAVPVPAAVWLLGSGLAGVLGLRRRA